MNWTWRLPWLTEEFESPLPATEVLARVQRATARPAHRLDLFSEQPAEFFRGKVFANGFELVRAVPKRHAAEPEISGVVVATHQQATCRVRIRFQLKALLFWAAWSIAALLWFFKAASTTSFGDALSGSLILPFIALLASCLLLPIAFGSEVVKSRSYLIRLLELKEHPLM